MYNKHIQAAALLLLGLLNIQTLQAGPPSGPNIVLEATADGLARLDVRLNSKGLKEPVKLQLKGEGNVVVGGVTLSSEYPTDYEITGFNDEGKATFSGKGTLPPVYDTDRPITLSLPPTGEGDGLAVSLTRERLVVGVQSEKGDLSAHLDVFDPLGNHKELKFEDIRWGLSDNRYLDIRQFGYDVHLPPKNQDIIKLCPLSTEVFICLPNGNCRSQKICSDPFVQISAGGDHTCALTQSGVAVCWGNNTNGELGVATTGSCSMAVTYSSECSRRPLPVVCPAGAPCRFTQISSGQTLTAAIDVNGDAWWWGRGGVAHHKVSAVLAGSPVKFSLVAAGFGHACAISQSRSEIWCWGANGYGEAGLPARTPMDVPDYSPTRVLVPFKFRKVVAGGEHTCAIGSASTDVVCWGRDDTYINQTRGTNSTQVGQFFFQQFGGLVTINDVAASMTSTCVTFAGGSVRCWGDFGNLFNGTPPITATDGIAAGYNHLCAITSQLASCIAGNAWGQLGIGSLNGQLVSTPVKAPPPLYTQISTGDSHTCGLTPEGDAFCWGKNGSGQVGNGTSGYGERAPVKVIP